MLQFSSYACYCLLQALQGSVQRAYSIQCTYKSLAMAMKTAIRPLQPASHLERRRLIANIKSPNPHLLTWKLSLPLSQVLYLQITLSESFLYADRMDWYFSLYSSPSTLLGTGIRTRIHMHMLPTNSRLFRTWKLPLPLSRLLLPVPTISWISGYAYPIAWGLNL